jgi:hypothetical protein
MFLKVIKFHLITLLKTVKPVASVLAYTLNSTRIPFGYFQEVGFRGRARFLQLTGVLEFHFLID